MITDEIYESLKKLNVTTILISHDIAEVTSFCDKVVVLSKRPGKVKSIHKIELDKRLVPSENRKDKNFNYFYDLLWGELDK